MKLRFNLKVPLKDQKKNSMTFRKIWRIEPRPASIETLANVFILSTFLFFNDFCLSRVKLNCLTKSLRSNFNLNSSSHHLPCVFFLLITVQSSLLEMLRARIVLYILLSWLRMFIISTELWIMRGKHKAKLSDFIK